MDKTQAEFQGIFPKISKVYRDLKNRHEIIESTRIFQLFSNFISMVITLTLCYKEYEIRETELVPLSFAIIVISSYNFIRVFTGKRELRTDFKELTEIFTYSSEKSRKNFFQTNIDISFFRRINEFLKQENNICTEEYNFGDLILLKQLNYICDGIILFSSTLSLIIYKSCQKCDNFLIEQILLIFTLLGLIVQYYYLIERIRYFESKRNKKIIKLFGNSAPDVNITPEKETKEDSAEEIIEDFSSESNTPSDTEESEDSDEYSDNHKKLNLSEEEPVDSDDKEDHPELQQESSENSSGTEASECGNAEINRLDVSVEAISISRKSDIGHSTWLIQNEGTSHTDENKINSDTEGEYLGKTRKVDSAEEIVKNFSSEGYTSSDTEKSEDFGVHNDNQQTLIVSEEILEPADKEDHPELQRDGCENPLETQANECQNADFNSLDIVAEAISVSHEFQDGSINCLIKNVVTTDKYKINCGTEDEYVAKARKVDSEEEVVKKSGSESNTSNNREEREHYQVYRGNKKKSVVSEESSESFSDDKEDHSELQQHGSENPSECDASECENTDVKRLDVVAEAISVSHQSDNERNAYLMKNEVNTDTHKIQINCDIEEQYIGNERKVESEEKIFKQLISESSSHTEESEDSEVYSDNQKKANIAEEDFVERDDKEEHPELQQEGSENFSVSEDSECENADSIGLDVVAESISVNQKCDNGHNVCLSKTEVIIHAHENELDCDSEGECLSKPRKVNSEEEAKKLRSEENTSNDTEKCEDYGAQNANQKQLIVSEESSKSVEKDHMELQEEGWKNPSKTEFTECESADFNRLDVVAEANFVSHESYYGNNICLSKHEDTTDTLKSKINCYTEEEYVDKSRKIDSLGEIARKINSESDSSSNTEESEGYEVYNDTQKKAIVSEESSEADDKEDHPELHQGVCENSLETEASENSSDCEDNENSSESEDSENSSESEVRKNSSESEANESENADFNRLDIVAERISVSLQCDDEPNVCLIKKEVTTNIPKIEINCDIEEQYVGNARKVESEKEILKELYSESSSDTEESEDYEVYSDNHKKSNVPEEDSVGPDDEEQHSDLQQHSSENSSVSEDSECENEPNICLMKNEVTLDTYKIKINFDIQEHTSRNADFEEKIFKEQSSENFSGTEENEDYDDNRYNQKMRSVQVGDSVEPDDKEQHSDLQQQSYENSSVSAVSECENVDCIRLDVVDEAISESQQYTQNELKCDTEGEYLSKARIEVSEEEIVMKLSSEGNTSKISEESEDYEEDSCNKKMPKLPEEDYVEPDDKEDYTQLQGDDSGNPSKTEASECETGDFNRLDVVDEAILLSHECDYGNQIFLIKNEVTTDTLKSKINRDTEERCVVNQSNVDSEEQIFKELNSECSTDTEESEDYTVYSDKQKKSIESEESSEHGEKECEKDHPKLLLEHCLNSSEPEASECENVDFNKQDVVAEAISVSLKSDGGHNICLLKGEVTTDTHRSKKKYDVEEGCVGNTRKVYSDRAIFKELSSEISSDTEESEDNGDSSDNQIIPNVPEEDSVVTDDKVEYPEFEQEDSEISSVSVDSECENTDCIRPDIVAEAISVSHKSEYGHSICLIENEGAIDTHESKINCDTEGEYLVTARKVNSEEEILKKLSIEGNTSSDSEESEDYDEYSCNQKMRNVLGEDSVEPDDNEDHPELQKEDSENPLKTEASESEASDFNRLDIVVEAVVVSHECDYGNKIFLIKNEVTTDTLKSKINCDTGERCVVNEGNVDSEEKIFKELKSECSTDTKEGEDYAVYSGKQKKSVASEESSEVDEKEDYPELNQASSENSSEYEASECENAVFNRIDFVAEAISVSLQCDDEPYAFLIKNEVYNDNQKHLIVSEEFSESVEKDHTELEEEDCENPSETESTECESAGFNRLHVVAEANLVSHESYYGNNICFSKYEDTTDTLKSKINCDNEEEGVGKSRKIDSLGKMVRKFSSELNTSSNTEENEDHEVHSETQKKAIVSEESSKTDDIVNHQELHQTGCENSSESEASENSSDREANENSSESEVRENSSESEVRENSSESEASECENADFNRLDVVAEAISVSFQCDDEPYICLIKNEVHNDNQKNFIVSEESSESVEKDHTELQEEGCENPSETESTECESAGFNRLNVVAEANLVSHECDYGNKICLIKNEVITDALKNKINCDTEERYVVNESNVDSEGQIFKELNSECPTNTEESKDYAVYSDKQKKSIVSLQDHPELLQEHCKNSSEPEGSECENGDFNRLDVVAEAISVSLQCDDEPYVCLIKNEVYNDNQKNLIVSEEFSESVKKGHTELQEEGCENPSETESTECESSSFNRLDVVAEANLVSHESYYGNNICFSKCEDTTDTLKSEINCNSEEEGLGKSRKIDSLDEIARKINSESDSSSDTEESECYEVYNDTQKKATVSEESSEADDKEDHPELHQEVCENSSESEASENSSDCEANENSSESKGSDNSSESEVRENSSESEVRENSSESEASESENAVFNRLDIVAEAISVSLHCDDEPNVCLTKKEVTTNIHKIQINYDIEEQYVRNTRKVESEEKILNDLSSESSSDTEECEDYEVYSDNHKISKISEEDFEESEEKEEDPDLQHEICENGSEIENSECENADHKRLDVIDDVISESHEFDSWKDECTLKDEYENISQEITDLWGTEECLERNVVNILDEKRRGNLYSDKKLVYSVLLNEGTTIVGKENEKEGAESLEISAIERENEDQTQLGQEGTIKWIERKNTFGETHSKHIQNVQYKQRNETIISESSLDIKSTVWNHTECQEHFYNEENNNEYLSNMENGTGKWSDSKFVDDFVSVPRTDSNKENGTGKWSDRKFEDDSFSAPRTVSSLSANALAMNKEEGNGKLDRKLLVNPAVEISRYQMHITEAQKECEDEFACLQPNSFHNENSMAKDKVETNDKADSKLLPNSEREPPKAEKSNGSRISDNKWVDVREEVPASKVYSNYYDRRKRNPKNDSHSRQYWSKNWRRK